MIASSNQYVPFLSNTYSGTVQDMKIAKQENCTYPRGIRLYKDLGYIGYYPNDVILMAPIKKLPKQELSSIQKWYNKTISCVRVSVEHAIAGIKRCRIIKERCRVHLHRREIFLLIATGLHNFRVFSPLRKYELRLNSKFS